MSDSPLNSSELRTLAAIADRIVPADAFPSASQAGAVAYVSQLLDRDLPQRWPELLHGLREMDSLADAAHARSFVELSATEQDALLTAIESGDEPDARRFFDWLITLVTESYYADPTNGGNAGAVSWTMVGFKPRLPKSFEDRA